MTAEAVALRAVLRNPRLRQLHAVWLGAGAALVALALARRVAGLASAVPVDERAYRLLRGHPIFAPLFLDVVTQRRPERAAHRIADAREPLVVAVSS